MIEHLGILEQARDLLAQGYVRDTYAVDARARAVLPTDPSASRWCFLGAILCAGEGRGRDLGRALAAFKRVCPHPQKAARELEQARAVLLMDRAIAVERRRVDARPRAAVEPAEE